ncbi:hypothetical protein CTP10_R47180 [Cupriavidus sp. P-10]|uniref:hypothetical protein n=1 Tax=Cupriavidus sp. P-10 TaxID=2027911 RepID=UPI0011C0CCA8|nr:hypothetical protein [Cupriavidus sp. P-10]BDB27313.1 hypothetical protein CTP10_R47180 [Cupriavidus sp. P-10]
MTRRGSRSDATASTRATVHQLCVAVAQCFALKSDQKLLIERLGDITVEGHTQFEVKRYHSKPLTDGSKNFWNTVYNWMDARFPRAQYASLILLTTQSFGTTAQLRYWNEMDRAGRLDLLCAIHANQADEFEVAQGADPELKRSKVLELQDWILDPIRRDLLESVVPKIYIEASAPDLSELYQSIQTEQLRVPAENKGAMMDALLGFVCRADQPREAAWEIDFRDFDTKLKELYDIHGKATRYFPEKPHPDRISEVPTDTAQDPFVSKILDIDYEDVIPEAIHHYQNAMTLIETHIQSYLIEPSRWKGYHSEVLDIFNANYRKAARNCVDEIHASQDFYDDVHGTGAPKFPGYDDSPTWFRNGLLHVEMNNSQLQWKLKKRRST